METKGFGGLARAADAYRASCGYKLWLADEGMREGNVLVLRLPLPPSVNHAFPTRNGIRVKSAEYQRWSQEATLLSNAAGVPFITTRDTAPPLWGLDTYFCFANWRSDMDNRYKVLIDFICRRFCLTDNRLMRHFSSRLPNDRDNTGVEALVHVW
jgi:Holliday junction resolvase RusA-like endonuclease